MKVANVTVTAIAQGLARGRHVSWKDVAEAAKLLKIPFGVVRRGKGCRAGRGFCGSRF